jgi:LmbE family N-acetylglucosaminyl deacetylase
VIAALLLLALVPRPSPLAAQSRGPGTGTAVQLDQDSLYLSEGRRVLVIGAHPDDEDTELITILSRGRGVAVAYLSLTRGEGGQNLIGGELGPALGIVRSEELLAARRVDGARQYFTRAFDFGFSKSAAEAFRFWPRDSLLKDVVRVIRRFRPAVIVSVWSGTPRDGHGHHQAAGIIAREAFDAAQDSTRFPDLTTEEGLMPWRPSKFYRDYGASGAGDSFAGGVLDRATGQSYHQLAAWSRSQHRSQDMGQLEEPGPSTRRIVLEAVAGGPSLARDTALFAGIPPVVPAVPERRARLALAGLGVVVDAYTSDATVTPGQGVPVTMLAWNTGPRAVRTNFAVLPTDGFRIVDAAACAAPMTVAPGAVVRCTARLEVRTDAPPGQPYYLVDPPSAGQYHWTGPRAAWGEPFGDPLQAKIDVTVADTTFTRVLPVQARSLDQGLGEVRQPVTIVPPVILAVTPGHLLWPADVTERRFVVTVEHASPDTVTAMVGLTVPAGWRVTAPVAVQFTRTGERRTLDFAVQRPAGSVGAVELNAFAAVGRDTLRRAVTRIAYPHIAPHLLFSDAQVAATVAPITFPTARRIGYFRGAADAIPEALDAAGVSYRLLTAGDLAGQVLDSLDVVVVGPRAYEVDPALGRANPLLLDFARAGGTLIVQYQQYQYVNGKLAPLPLTISRPHDRVTDENATVTWLPGSTALQQRPNRLTADDWSGWVQERGLYFAGTWDAGWTPLLAMHDPGEPEQRGALLVARYGRGTVVYTGLAFFRQLPAAVPGAWRLFANLLAIGSGE